MSTARPLPVKPSRPVAAASVAAMMTARLRGVDDVVDLEGPGDVEGVDVLSVVNGQLPHPLVALALVGDGGQLLPLGEPHGALKAHGAQVGERPGHSQQRLVGAAAQHRLRPEPVAAAEDDADQGDLQPGTRDQDPGGVPEHRRPLRVRAGHDPRGVHQRDQRDAEGVAQLHEPGRLVRGVGCQRAGHVQRLVGEEPDGTAVDAPERGHHLGCVLLAQEGHRALVSQGGDDRADVVRAALPLREDLSQHGLVRRRAGLPRALEVADQGARDRDGLGLVGGQDVDNPLGRQHLGGPDLLGLVVPEPGRCEHRWAGDPHGGVLRGHDQVGRSGQDGVPCEAPAGDDGDARGDPGEPRPQREGADVQRRDDRVVGVARAPAAPLGEEHGGQPQPLNQPQQPVGLVMASHALRARHDEVVVRQHAAGGSLPRHRTVDAGDTADDAVRRRLPHELVGAQPPLLCCRDQPAVLDERARVDEVGDVLPRRPTALGAPSGDLVRPGRVLGEGPAPPQLVQRVGASIVAHRPTLPESMAPREPGTAETHRRGLARPGPSPARRAHP